MLETCDFGWAQLHMKKASHARAAELIRRSPTAMMMSATASIVLLLPVGIGSSTTCVQPSRRAACCAAAHARCAVTTC